MKIYKIAFHGDNDALHQQALRAAVAAARAVNRTPAYRAWIEDTAEMFPGPKPETRSAPPD